MIKPTEWIRTALEEESNPTNIEVKSMYEGFKKQTRSNASYRSFQSMIRKEQRLRKGEKAVTDNLLKGKIREKQVQTEISVLKKENKELVSQSASYQTLVDILTNFNEVPYKFPHARISPIKSDSSRVGFVTFSDFHWGEIVHEEEVFGLNEYSIMIAKERIDELFDQLTDRLVEMNLDTLYIAILGDMVDGIIQPDSLRNSDAHIVEAVVQLADYLALKIVEIAHIVDKIHINTICGNHGRILPGKPNSKSFTGFNFDQFVYHFLERKLKGEVASYKINDSIFDVWDVNGTNIFLTHGQIFGGGGSGYVPIPNGISKNMSKLNSLLQKQGCMPDIAVCGHFHLSATTISLDMVPVYINGSLVGGNEYSINKLCRASRPSQNFFVLEDGQGIIYQSTLYLDK